VRERAQTQERGGEAIRPGAGRARDFALLWLALIAMGTSVQMLEVAIGWEVYSNHPSALNLGWIGLAEFVPMFLLALPSGQLADRLPRRLVLGLRCC
jgi:MFS family permease